MNSQSHNIRALDGIRWLAIILVMFHHFEPLIPPSDLLIKSVKRAFSFGWVGVDLFFALSGFLVPGILLDTRQAKNYFGGILCKADSANFSSVLLRPDCHSDSSIFQAPATAEGSVSS